MLYSNPYFIVPYHTSTVPVLYTTVHKNTASVPFLFAPFTRSLSLTLITRTQRSALLKVATRSSLSCLSSWLRLNADCWWFFSFSCSFFSLSLAQKLFLSLSLSSISCLFSTRQGNPPSLSPASLLPLSYFLFSLGGLFGQLVVGLVGGSVGVLFGRLVDGLVYGVAGLLVEWLVAGLIGVFSSLVAV